MWNVSFGRGVRVAGFVAVSIFIEGERKTMFNRLVWGSCARCRYYSKGTSVTLRVRPCCPEDYSARGQLADGSRPERDRIGVAADDGGAANLKRWLKVMGVPLEAQWIHSAVNTFYFT